MALIKGLFHVLVEVLFLTLVESFFRACFWLLSRGCLGVVVVVVSC